MPFARKSAKPRAFLNEAALSDYAVKALRRRRVSPRVEQANPGKPPIPSVLARLKDYGYLNDQSFAETYARLRQENEKFGQRRRRQSLGQKGVAPEIVNKVVEASYAQPNEEALARQHLERKRIRKP